MIGLFTRIASVLTFILIVLNYSFVFSIGGASSLLIIPLFFLVLGFSNWNASFSLDALLLKKSKPTNTVFIVIILLTTLTFSFFISAFMKIKGGWFSLDSQAVFVYWVSNYFIDSRVSILNPDNFYINSKLFWEAIDYLVVLIEAAPFLLFWNKKFLRVSFLFLGIFQLLVYVFLNISFSIFPIMYCFFMIDTENSVLYKKSAMFFNILFQKKHISKIVIVSLLAFFIYVYFYFFGNRNGWNKDFPTMQLLGLWISFGLYVYLFIESSINSNKISS